MTEERRPRKIVVVGDGGCGKTSLLLKYLDRKFDPEYTPTVFGKRDAVYTDESGKKVLLDLWDTAGQEDYERIRTLSYIDTDLLLVCFALNSKASFLNVLDRWQEEIEHFCKDTPRILVGMKADLRSKEDLNLVTSKRAVAMAKKIGARSYVECSARTGDNIEEVFHLAVDVLLCRKRKAREKTSACRTM